MDEVRAVEARAEDRSRTVLTPTITGGRERHVWVPLKNEPGELRRIDKHLLHQDPRYQRRINERQVARMVGNWNWISCGVLEVAERPGTEGVFVIDGQHRWKASTYLDAVADLPCIVFQLDEVREEAIAFLAANVERRMPSVSDQFKALLLGGDPIATAIDKMTTQYSRSIGWKQDGEHIGCLGVFATLMRRNRAATERIFPVVASLARSRAIPGRLLRAFHWLERCMPSGQSLSDDKWHYRLISDQVGYDAVLQGIRQAAAVDPRGADRAYAQGLLRAINRGLRAPAQLHITNIDAPRRR